MRTRNMNERITFFEEKNGKNEDGEIVEGVRKDLFACWAEISKSKVKEFRDRTSVELSADGIKKRKNTNVFIIRYDRKREVDTTLKIDFRGHIYEITDVEMDFSYKDFSLISGVLVE